MELREYQKEAIEATIRALEYNKNNPCIVAPTGSGKSIIIAFLIKRILETKPNARFLILTHIKELIVQNHAKIIAIMPEYNIGIFCAGLDKKESDKSILFGSLLSCVKSVQKLGIRDYIIIDEAHRLNPKEKSSYKKIINYFRCKVIGLTATPFRTSDGSIIGDNNVLGAICYDISVQTLIKDGYISKPVTKDAINRIDTNKIHIKKGDFDLNEMADKMKDTVIESIKEVINKASLRNYFLCFCCTIEHAKNVCQEMNNAGIEAKVAHSKLCKNERDEIIKDFREKKYKCLVNVNILTEGFDAPFVDCIILMRATVSPGLYCQMVGRGFRITDEKKDFLILDFGENARRHGCIDDIQIKSNKLGNKKKNAPVKICPTCQTVVSLASKFCSECNYEFISEQKLISDNVNAWADENDILSDGILEKEHIVKFIEYSAHYKAGKPPSLKITYHTGHDGLIATKFYEYICLFHDGYAGTKAVRWWFSNVEIINNILPSDIEEAVLNARGFAKSPTRVKVKKNGAFWNVVDCYYD